MRLGFYPPILRVTQNTQLHALINMIDADSEVSEPDTTLRAISRFTPTVLREPKPLQDTLAIKAFEEKGFWYKKGSADRDNEAQGQHFIKEARSWQWRCDGSRPKARQ